MNDRASQMPPSPYLGDEEIIRERFEQDELIRGRKIAQPRHSVIRTESSTTFHTDTSRQSAIFRFGKSIAATFNPGNWFGRQKQTGGYVSETPQQRLMRKRKEKAEKVYEEMKQSGQFRDSSVNLSFLLQEEDDVSPTKRDSGIVFGNQFRDGEISREEKRMGRVFLDTPFSEKRTESMVSMVSQAPSASGSVRKSGFKFRRPSLGSLSKGRGGSEAGSARNTPERQAKRISSRKDLHKQQKLVKRVSDLEGKLDAARKDLLNSMGEPLPSELPVGFASNSQVQSYGPRVTRPRFIPGALSSLPSERLLAGYVPSDDDEAELEKQIEHEMANQSHLGRHLEQKVVDQIGMAFTTDRALEPDVPEVKHYRQHTPETSPIRSTILPQLPALLNNSPFKLSNDSLENVMQSVEEVDVEYRARADTEYEEGIDIKPAQKVATTRSASATRRKPVTTKDHALSDASSSHYSAPTTNSYKDVDVEADEEDDEDDIQLLSEEDMDPVKRPLPNGPSIPKPQVKRVVPATTLKTPTKKRKSRSSFERIANDGGRYKPSGNTDDSDSDSFINKARIRNPKKTPTKSPAAARPNKLQKSAQPKVSSRKEAIITPPKASATRQPAKPILDLSPTETSPRKQPSPVVSRSSSKLSKTRKSLPSESSPHPTKPSSNASVSKRDQHAKAVIDLISEDELNAIPPLPPMPSAVQLPNGEIISTGKLTKPRPSDAHQDDVEVTPKAVRRGRREESKENGEGRVVEKDSFVWDRDTF